MKKLISLTIILMMVMVATAIAAPPIPKPVKITALINDETVNEVVEIKNERTNEIIEKTMINGIAGFSMDEFIQGYWSSSYSQQTGALLEAGDTVRFSICDAEVCTREVIIDDNNFPLYVDFNIEDSAYVKKYVCCEGSIKANQADCPKCVSDGDGDSNTVVVEGDCPAEKVCPTEKVCDTCTTTTCDEPVACPEVPETDDDNLIVNLIVGVLSAAGGVGLFFGLFNNKIFTSKNTGLKTYRGRDGELKILHKHPGTTGYHDPDTQHHAPETHPKGKIDVGAGYMKDANGKWEYKD